MQSSQTLNTNPIVQRAIGIATLRNQAVTAIARDPAATAQAAVVIAVAALANAIGGGADSFREFVFAFGVGFASWFIFAALAFSLSTRFFGTPTTHATPEALIRTLGFARGPAVLGIVGLMPFFGELVAGIGNLWMLVACVFVVRYTLGLTIVRSLLTVVVASILATLIGALLAVILGVDPGFGAVFL